MITTELDGLAIPGFEEAFSLDLPPELAALRDRAREVQAGPRLTLVEMPIIDAQAWADHTDDEDWLLWRGRRCAARLGAMPIELEPGECIVGRPRLREAADADRPALEDAQSVLSTMPAFPGGDAGHFHPDYEKLFEIGVGGTLDEIAERQRGADLTGEERAFYQACRIAMEGMATYIRRVADACGAMAEGDEEDPARWRELAAVCRRVVADPPQTFREAIQLMFLTEIALWFGEDHGLSCPGRMDQTLRRFYEADRAAGRITPREAFELICCLYIHMNRILWPGSAVAVMVGGRDRDGRDVTNELTYLCLAARAATRLVYPTVGLAWHGAAPDELMDFCTDMACLGIGDPAFFNDEVISEGLREQGATEADSYNYMNSTCVEIKVAGASNIWVTQPYINMPQALLRAMDKATQDDGDGPDSFDALQALVRKELGDAIRAGAENRHGVWQARTESGCFPLASCVVRDCLERGRDFDRGGARYNWVENSFVGLANLVDGLLALKHLVYEQRELTLRNMQEVLARDFEGDEALRQRILNTVPKYGNADPGADELAREWAEFSIDATESHTVGLHHYVSGFFCWVMHERLGTDTGATPDGRRAGLPLADGAGAAQGRDRAGPTASALSTTAWCHRKALGGLVHNAKFSQTMLQSPAARGALRSVTETYLKRGGFEMQINVVGADVLRDAQKHPEQHQDLLVRVAGYSDYFVHLNEKMQDEVIARTEHEL